MEFYNTLTRQKSTFTPIEGDTVRVYSCGPTVYDHAHIGNLSAYIFADTLQRALQLPGWQVKHVMNYTDVDDKTIRRSLQLYPALEPTDALKKLTDHYIAVFLKDMNHIGNDTNNLIFIRATETIKEMQDLITKLFRAGIAYIADDGVYFSIAAYRRAGKKYGQLIELDANNTSVARIQNDEYDKDSIHDFALWKKQKGNEPAWKYTIDSTDITGRPGWHIECSAMSEKVLGRPFDIHTGGIDLIFPHHENEIAQSTATQDSDIMATFFMHNNHVLIDGKKMAKSANNFYTLEDVVRKGYDPLAFRMLVLQGHYRTQINFTWESLEAAQNRLRNWQAVAVLRYQAKDTVTHLNQDQYLDWVNFDIKKPMYDDLNTPLILANISRRFTFFSEKLIANTEDSIDGFETYLKQIDSTLGLNLFEQKDINDEQKELLMEREKARIHKDWQKSDQIRDMLTSAGIGIRDTEIGTIWFRL